MVDNYKQKFDRVLQPNEFSVSTLVDGPGAAVKYRTISYDPNVQRAFNLYFFRGTAIHELINDRLSKSGTFEPGTWEDSWLLREEVSMKFPGNDGEDLTVIGHPDASNTVRPIVLEFKTFDSENQDYRKRVLKKAIRQVGCYAKMKALYDGEEYEAFVVILDFVKKTPLTDAQMEAGFGLKNGLIEYQLTEMDLEYGQVLNDPILYFKVPQEEIDHSYNYVRWCAREAAKRMSDESFGLEAGLI